MYACIGNMDPMILHTNKQVIEREAHKILSQTKGNCMCTCIVYCLLHLYIFVGLGKRHIMNLGHGIDSTTPEENVQHLVNYVKNYKL